MVRVVAAVVLCLVVIAFSGCAAPDTKGTANRASDLADLDSQAADGAAQGAGEAGQKAGSNVPRILTMTTSTVNGTVPWEVEFALNSTGIDTGVQWVLDFGDNATEDGTTLPATAIHTYDVAGDYTAQFTVTFADGEVLNVSVALQATGGATVYAPGTFLRDEALSYAGTLTIGTQGPDGCAVQGSYDKKLHTWTVPAVEADGTPSVVNKLVVHLAFGTTNLDSDIYLRGPDGAEVGKGVAWNYVDNKYYEDFTVSKELVPGVYTFEVQGCVAVNGSYTITGTATHVAM